jgi:hypothetical protein
MSSSWARWLWTVKHLDAERRAGRAARKDIVW